VLGGVAGWLLGYYAYELIARPVLEFYGSLDKFEMLRSSSSRDAILLMLITSGIAHLPPMKVVTILSGAAAIDGWLFVASAIVARGGKFFVIAWLLRRYGEPIRHFIEKRLGLVALAAVLALVLVYFALKMLLRAGT
jgi:membrane protein YqaA with SNARE-associated domain